MPDFRVPSKANVPIGPGTKVFTSLFFLFFLGIGSVFVWLVAREAVAGIGTWTWRKTSCEITHCEVSKTGKRGQRTGNYYVAVTYRYTFNDQTFDSKKLSLTPKSFSDYGAAARLAAHYPPGGKTICYVNSSAAAEAVLERGNLLFPFLVLFPMIFVAIGAGGIYATWRRKPKPEESVRAISDLAGGRIAPVFVFVFFSIFLLVGGGLSYTFFLRPVFNVISAKRWPAVPCVVISSQVRTHHSGDGSTYSINILYSYDLNGRELKANRYSFMGASPSGYKGKSAIVARYPPGTETICYVNPSDPTDAVLQRGFTAEMWLGLIPLLFATIGAGGLVFAFRKRRQNRLTGAIGQRTEFGDAVANTFPGLHQTESSERRLLRPKVSPLCKWLIAIAIALFWNGIVSVFLAQIIRSRGSGPMEWFLAIFLIPFVVIGLGLLCASAYFFLALFNPRPRLRATPGLVPLGGARGGMGDPRSHECSAEPARSFGRTRRSYLPSWRKYHHGKERLLQD